MSELLPFKTEVPGSFRFARSLTMPARKKLEFINDIPTYAKDVGAKVAVDLKRASVDIISIEESAAIVEAYPNLQIKNLLYILSRAREKHDEYGRRQRIAEKLRIKLGEVVDVSIAEHKSMIGYKILRSEYQLGPDHEVIRERILSEWAGEIVELEAPDDYYVGVAEYDPRDDTGIDNVMDFIDANTPEQPFIDLHDVRIQAYDLIRRSYP